MDKQSQIFNSYKNENNILITGPAGTGKTYCIKKIYDDATSNKIKISVTAMTGVASLLLDCNATTLHSWAGIGLGKGSHDEIIAKICKSKSKMYNWKNTEILVVDEISMLSNSLFELLDKIAKKIRNNSEPFGGIKIIFCGDFFQLPPISFGNEDTFCFQNKNFLKSFDKIFILTKIYRQNDYEFKKILVNLRKGLISKNSIEKLESRVIKNLSHDEKYDLYQIEDNISRLVPTKNMANEINQKFINKIDEEIFIFNREFKECREELQIDEKLKLDLITNQEKEIEFEYIKQNTLTEDTLQLKLNAFVMCIANIDVPNGIVNGSQGRIVGFDKDGYPEVFFFNKKNSIIIKKHKWKSESIPGLCIYQIPLILAWGITIHKAQGLTLDRAIIDVGNKIFEAGQTYVALSRIKSLEGLYLENFNLNKLKINYDVLNFYKLLEGLEKKS